MAKQTEKRRVFFVQLNIEEFTDAVGELLTTEDQAMFLLGMQRGCRGLGKHEQMEQKSRSFLFGYEYGMDMHKSAAEQYEKSRENGRKSAEARARKHGTAQPKRTTSSETPSTKSRNPLRFGSEGVSNGSTRGVDSDFGPNSERPSDRRNPFDHKSKPLGSDFDDLSNGSASPFGTTRTQDPVASSQDQGWALKDDFKGECAYTRENDEQQDENEEQPRYRTVLYPSGPVRERIYA